MTRNPVIVHTAACHATARCSSVLAWAGVLLGATLAGVGCGSAGPVESGAVASDGARVLAPGADPSAPGSGEVGVAVEVAVQVIPLQGPARSREAEISGLAWYGDHLVLLPQFPNRFDAAVQCDGVLFAIADSDLRDFVAGRRRQPIEPRIVPLDAPGLFDRVPDMQGVEAIAFRGDRVFVTIESGYGNRMMGYLVAGQVAPDLARITLDTGRMVEIPAQRPIRNASEESVLVTRDRVITIYEANGAAVNPAPVAHVFTHALEPLGTISFPGIEYRVIDATDLDAQDRFWVVNYFYTGDRDEYRPVDDPIARAHGRGRTHRASQTVERLLLLQYSDAGIERVERAPIQLVLADQGRNWEGVVRWGDEGFLLVTDMFPATILAFVPYREVAGTSRYRRSAVQPAPR